MSSKEYVLEWIQYSELLVEEYHAIKALDNANQLCQWIKVKIQCKIATLP